MPDADASLPDDLWQRVRAGDHAAVAELWIRFEPEIRRTLRVRLWQSGLRGREDTEDRLQSVALLFFDRLDRGKLDQRLDELESPQELLNLLQHMARGKFVDWIRRRGAQRRGEQKKQSLDAMPCDPPVDETGASRALQHEELVQQGLALLTGAEQRIAELLRTGHNWQQIADQLDTTREAVRKQFYRAVDRLRKQLFESTSDDTRPKRHGGN